jgi:co-chaperonin GroES (HSP10)
MKSLGKTYLVKIEDTQTEMEGGIYIPQTASRMNTIPYIGRIHDYGLGFSEEEKKDLIPIGTKVIMNYLKNAEGKIRLIFGKDQFYVQPVENILAIIEED